MNLHDLSTELVLAVASHLSSIADLSALCQVNSHLYQICIATLYHINIHQDHSSALQWAAIHNLPNLARKLLAHSANIKTTTKPPGKGLPVSFRARCCPEFAKYMTTDQRSNSWEYCNFPSTPLMFAAAAGYTDVVRVLLDHGLHGADVTAHVNWRNSYGYTALSIAAMGGFTDAMELLLAHGATASVFAFGHDIIHDVAKMGHSDPLRLLVQHGVPVDKEANYGKRPLMLAAEQGNLDAVKTLLELGADLTPSNYCNRSALYGAVSNDHADVVALLLDKGAELTRKNQRGWALGVAAMRGSMKVANLLLDRGVDINELNSQSLTPINLAAPKLRMDMVKMLVSRGAKTEVKRPLWIARTVPEGDSHLEMVDFLLEHGADPNRMHVRGPEALWFAAITGDEDLMAKLLAKGADPHTRADRKSVLCVAIQRGRTAAVKLLLEYKADPNTMDKPAKRFSPMPALAWAIKADREDIAQLLIDYGADVNWGQRRPLLTGTIVVSRHRCTLLLLENGADANRLDSRGRSPLFLAMMKGYKEVARWLLEHGANVNEKRRGETMLSWGAKWEEQELQGLLREYGGQMT